MSDLFQHCSCGAPEDAEPEDHDDTCPVNPGTAETTRFGVRGVTPGSAVVAVPSKAAAHARRRWRDSAECAHCGREITTWHPYPDRLPREWTHAADGSWKCRNSSGRHAEPKEA